MRIEMQKLSLCERKASARSRVGCVLLQRFKQCVCSMGRVRMTCFRSFTLKGDHGLGNTMMAHDGSGSLVFVLLVVGCNCCNV